MTRKTLALNGRSISLEDGSVGGRDHPPVSALCLGIAGGGEYVELTLTQATSADLVAELAHFQQHGRLRPEAAAPLPVEGEPGVAEKVCACRDCDTTGVAARRVK